MSDLRKALIEIRDLMAECKSKQEFKDAADLALESGDEEAMRKLIRRFDAQDTMTIMKIRVPKDAATKEQREDGS